MKFFLKQINPIVFLPNSKVVNVTIKGEKHIDKGRREGLGWVVEWCWSSTVFGYRQSLVPFSMIILDFTGEHTIILRDHTSLLNENLCSGC